MSDTNKNHDLDEPQNGDNHIKNNEKEDLPEKTSSDQENLLPGEISPETENDKPDLIENSSGEFDEIDQKPSGNENFTDQKDAEQQISDEFTSKNVNNDKSKEDDDYDSESKKPAVTGELPEQTHIPEEHSEIESSTPINIEDKKIEPAISDSNDDIVIEKPAKNENTVEGTFGETLIDEKSSAPQIQPKTSKPRESNYQISLIDENLLKINVSTKKGVKINSSVKEEKSSVETQSNEIYLNPRQDYNLQEVEILIAIEDSPKEEIKMPEDDIIDTHEKINEPVDAKISSAEVDENFKSNYQINLINENLLKIKILTGNAVKIDSIARDKNILSQTHSNKIYLKPKIENELQNIEITVAIDSEKDLKDDLAGKTDDGKIRLIPNPEVVDLIKPPDYSSFTFDGTGESVNETGYKNPFDSLRKLIRKNLIIGITAAVILHAVVAALAFFSISKKSKEQVPEEQTRLIVIQDLPDPKIKLEDVEDPNKPKVEEPVVTEPEKINIPKREITPRRTIKPPIVSRPKREDVKLDSSVEANLSRELDSLRKLVDESLDSLSDSTKVDTSKSVYEIPDSLKNNFNESDIGLAMYFPKSWKLTDQRDINKNEKDFKGVVLTDTTAEQPGTMTLFIFLDNENKDYNAEDFKTDFKMNDSSLSAFSKEPKTLAGFTEYRFYIFNKLGTEKLSLRASVRKQFFDQYKNEIEAVVRSIKIRKKEDL